MVFNFYHYLWCIAGIVISVLLPIGWAAVRQFFPVPTNPTDAKALAVPDLALMVWAAVKPYALLGVVSAITAVLLIAFLGEAIVDWRAALLAGYAWDSTLQKLAK